MGVKSRGRLGSGPMSAEAAQQLRLWGSQTELEEELEGIFLASPTGSVALMADPESRSVAYFRLGESMLTSSFKELDMEAVEVDIYLHLFYICI